MELPQLTAKRDLQVCEASLNIKSSNLLRLTNHQDLFPQTLKIGKLVFWFVIREV